MFPLKKLVILMSLILNSVYSQKNNDLSKIIFPGESARQSNTNYNQQRYHYHHHHHHNHDDNDTNNRNSAAPTTKSYTNETKIEEIPIDFVAKLNGQSYVVNDFLLHYVEGYEEDDFFESRFGEAEERANAQIPKPAQCMPELQTVSLQQSDDPTAIYIPSCTRIERCGGCCNHNKLECQATEVENVNYQVIKTKYVKAKNSLRMVEKIAVTLERHKKCTCGCKVKAENCTLRQEYRGNECRCACRNTDEQKKCSKHPMKLWDSESCECQCRNSTICSTGTTFDFQLCKCVLSTSMRRRFVDFPNNNSMVLPLDEN